MFTVNRLEEVIVDQEERSRRGIRVYRKEVDLDRYLGSPQIVVISEVGRCGKSTLLRQFGENLGDFLYVNPDDEWLIGFAPGDFETFMLVFRKLHPGVRVMLIDEVRNVEQWERLVRRVHTGGNASHARPARGTGSLLIPP